MIRTTGLLALAALFTVPTVHAAEIRGEATFAWAGTGTTYTLGDGHPYFVGAFSGINIFKADAGVLSNSAIECPGYNDVGVGAAGYCTVTASDGDKLFLKWSCEAVAPAPGDLVACDGKTIVTGGTGKFEKATGGNDLASHIRAIGATGTAMGYTELTNYVVTY
ncbi:MAG: hypothetical protein ABL879_09915 [Devosia sp.]